MLQRIGRYEILERIATGGQGTVYRATDTVLDRVVTVKVINQSIADDPAYLAAFQREDRLAARLDHPNITTVLDFQVGGGNPYIVMGRPGQAPARWHPASLVFTGGYSHQGPFNNLKRVAGW